jgi:hypothetical protein
MSSFGLTSKGHAFLQLVLVAGALELLDQILHGDEVNRVACYDRFRAERDAEVSLADARRPEQHVLLALEENERGQLPQLVFIDRGLEGEIELV